MQASTSESAKMSSRRYHQKSKHGCNQCKRRRVKCDEGHPICRNCSRTKMECSYNPELQRSDSNSTAAPSPRAPSHTPAPSLPPCNTFDLLDMGLMYHYTAVTSNSVFPDGNARSIWQETIPIISQKHPFLMHGVLAMSAMHLACLKGASSPEYRIRALHHQNAGVLGFRSALTTISKENAHVLFAFSMILSILAFAYPQLSEISPDVDTILEMFSLLQGNRLVWSLEQDNIQSSVVARLLPKHHSPPPGFKLNAELDAGLIALQGLSDDVAWLNTVENLRICVEVAIAAPDEVPMAARWLVTMDEKFSFQMKAHKAEALVMLAHYALVVKSYRQTWWLSGWSKIIVDAVDNELSDKSKEAVGWQTKLEFLRRYIT